MDAIREINLDKFFTGFFVCFQFINLSGTESCAWGSILRNTFFNTNVRFLNYQVAWLFFLITSSTVEEATYSSGELYDNYNHWCDSNNVQLDKRKTQAILTKGLKASYEGLGFMAHNNKYLLRFKHFAV